MRIVRIQSSGGPRYGALDGDLVVPLTGAPWLAGGSVPTGEAPIALSAATLLVPAEPGTIFGIGRNYPAHARELGNEVPREPLVFLKARGALLPHGGTVVLPASAGRVDFEGELALVIGRRARNVPAERWRDVVFGVTTALDITSRDLQKKDGQWWRAKGFDTFCPLGPVIDSEVEPGDLLLETRVDDRLAQSTRTSQMIFDVGTIVAFLSGAVTLEPGDVILTGTPDGVAPLAAGQSVDVSIEGLPTLSVRVSEA